MSDVHVGSGLFRPEMLSAVIQEANDLEPDLVAVVGDLTMEGYRWEFEEARGYLDGLKCENVVVGMGNHDARRRVRCRCPRGRPRSSRSTPQCPTSTRASSVVSITAGSTPSFGAGTGDRRS